MFAGTIRENITYGSSTNITESEIIEATRAVNIHDFVISQRDGYETWCGDKGLQLSSGQKQRIAIARAIVRNPTILLLDEASSALDRHSEKVVHEALEGVMMGRTSVFVAHRLSTVRNCGRIIVMDNGKVVEEGTHLTLMAMGFHTSLPLTCKPTNYGLLKLDKPTVLNIGRLRYVSSVK